ncbi:hypothetical protein DIPPA_06473 [Diplonema papillatum]|nr:hypothetical protein DIPPA_06473 [Diplonema papillatum]
MHDLTPHEWQKTRTAYGEVMGDKPWITSVFELQSVCAQLGLNPCLEEMEEFVQAHGSKFDFMALLGYVELLKREFFAPEPLDVDTVRAFAAVGGSSAEGSTISCKDLLGMCNDFNLILQDDNRFTGDDCISYPQFRALLAPTGEPKTERKQLNLGHDFGKLMEEQRLRDVASQGQRRRTKRASALQIGRRRSNNNPLTPTTAPPARRPSEPPHVQSPASAANLRHSAFEEVQPPAPPAEGKGKSSRRKGRKHPFGGSGSTKQHVLGPHTRPCGRTGVYVDDSPQIESWLPSILKMKSPTATSPVLARIDARIESQRPKVHAR